MRRDVTRERCLPPDAEQREPEPHRQRDGDHDGERSVQRERGGHRRPREHEQQPDVHRPPGSPANSDQRAEYGAAARNALEHAEDAGAPVQVSRDDRRERIPLRVQNEHHAGEGRNRHPHPRAGDRLVPAGTELGDHGRRGGRSHLFPAHAATNANEQRGADDEGERVEQECLPGADAEHERGRERRTDQHGQVVGRLGQRGRVEDQRLGHRLRDQPRVRRLEERPAGAERGLYQDELQDRDAAREDQDRDGQVQPGPDCVGREHDLLARQPVGPHPAEQHQRDHRQRLRRQHEPEVGRRPGLARDEQRQRDDHDLVADRAGGLAEEQITEVLVAQQAPVRTHLHSLESNGTAGTARPESGPLKAGGGRVQRAPTNVARIGGRVLTRLIRVMLSIVSRAYQSGARRQLELQ